MNGGKVRSSMSMEAYRRLTTGEGLSHQERMSKKVTCDICGTTVNHRGLKAHQRTRKCAKGKKDCHDVTGLFPETTESAEEPTTLSPPSENRISMDGKTATACPVEGCTFRQTNRCQMRRHFRTRHIHDTIVIEEEGPLPRCGSCGIFQRNVGPKHRETADCKSSTKTHKDRAKFAEHQKTAAETIFTVNGVPIKNVSEFKYLGRIVAYNDDDWPAVIWNLKKARIVWGKLGRILSKEGTNPKAMASVYKAVVQAVLLYGSESWVLTRPLEYKLQSFHRRCARYITGQHIRQNLDGSWTCPSSAAVLEQAGLCTIQEYIQRRRTTVETYARSLPIYNRCEASHPLASNPNQCVWWRKPPVVMV
jgi:hypothetical protein